MRTTFTLADDLAAGVERFCRSEDIGVDDALNRLIRRGMATGVDRQSYRHKTTAIGVKVDINCIGALIDRD